MHNVHFEEKGGQGKYNRAKSCVQENKQIKEKPDTKWNKRSGELRTRPHLMKLPVCQKELKKIPGLVWGHTPLNPALQGARQCISEF